MSTSTPRTEYRTDDEELRTLVEAALERSRADSRWFAITTVILTPFAMLLAVGVLAVTIQMIGADSQYDYDYDWIVGITFANVIMGYLVFVTARGHWGSRWVLGGMGAYVLMLLLTYVPDLDTWSLTFLAPWTVLAIGALTLVSQEHEDTPGEAATAVTVIPNMILSSYRMILRDLWFRDRGGLDVQRAIAMLQAVHVGDANRQQRLLDAATGRGIDLRQRLIQAKLVREYKEQLRLGDAAPPLHGGSGPTL